VKSKVTATLDVGARSVPQSQAHFPTITRAYVMTLLTVSGTTHCANYPLVSAPVATGVTTLSTHLGHPS
jgi:hypothetical protein